MIPSVPENKGQSEGDCGQHAYQSTRNSCRRVRQTKQKEKLHQTCPANFKPKNKLK